MQELGLFVLRMATKPDLEEAFGRVMDAPQVDSSVIEPDRLQIRFLAPEHAARQVIERIYLDGGLVWSSRHALSDEEAGEQADA